MRIIEGILLLVITVNLHGQSNIRVNFPDSLKNSSSYVSPYTRLEVSPPLMGILNLNEPFDSAYPQYSSQYFLQADYLFSLSDSVCKSYSKQTGLKIFADTTQEINQDKYFSETYDYDSFIKSPRYLKLWDEKGHVKTIRCKKATTITLKSMPVYIFNPTPDTLHIIDRDLTINLSQEVLDKHGNWIEIERYQTGDCSMGWGWRPLLPGKILITCVLKYKGSYKTLARLKLESGNITYSQPYRVRINPDVLSNKVKTAVMDNMLFEVK